MTAKLIRTGGGGDKEVVAAVTGGGQEGSVGGMEVFRGHEVVIAAGAMLFLGVGMAHPLWVLTFVIIGSVFMCGLGIIAAIFANKFDQLAAISNFIVTPLSFLSGTFYSIDALPPVLRAASHANPFFYIIDGVRFGMLDVSDSSPWRGLAVASLASALVLALCWYWFKRGYRLKA